MEGADGNYIFLKTIQAIDVAGVRQGDGTIPAGNHTFDIRFLFPTEVNLFDSLTRETVKGKGPHFKLSATPQAVSPSPQTTRDTLGTIEYDLTLVVEHGKMFKRSAKYVDCFLIAHRGRLLSYRLRTRVMFIPSIVPDPPSILRQTAYRDCIWAPDPRCDPAGWTSLPPLVLRGVFESKEEVVNYTVRRFCFFLFHRY